MNLWSLCKCACMMQALVCDWYWYWKQQQTPRRYQLRCCVFVCVYALLHSKLWSITCILQCTDSFAHSLARPAIGRHTEREEMKRAEPKKRETLICCHFCAWPLTSFLRSVCCCCFLRINLKNKNLTKLLRLWHILIFRDSEIPSYISGDADDTFFPDKISRLWNLEDTTSSTPRMNSGINRCTSAKIAIFDWLCLNL